MGLLASQAHLDRLVPLAQPVRKVPRECKAPRAKKERLALPVSRATPE